VVTKKESNTKPPVFSGAPTARGMATSVALHVAVLILLLLLPARALIQNARSKEIDMVFYRPPKQVEVPAPPAPMAAPANPAGVQHARRPAPPPLPHATIPSVPPGPGTPEKPPGPDLPPQQPVGNLGILALHDTFSSLTKDKVSPRLGKDAHITDADNGGKSSSPSALTSSASGGSGGIDLAALKRSVGGGGGGGVGGGPGGGGVGGGMGVEVGRETSPIAPGGDRPLAHKGAGPARTDEEIQIVFDRYKASFYRLYNRELRKDPTLKGQMVLRLTIEPDGSVSMCKLQSSDMNAPELADQVVGITKTINFGAKDGVQALTISYPIDFLPAT
jgi:hypothetical protein